VWSWAPGHPAAGGDCAVQGADGRFHASGCGGRHAVACLDGSRAWHVTAGRFPLARAAHGCDEEFPGSTFAVPRNGLDNVRLSTARSGGIGDVWLNYGRTGDTWRPDVAG
jgi:hypothetical protein